MNFPPGNLVGQLSESHDAAFVRHVVRGVLEALKSYHSRGRSYGQVRPDTIYLAGDGRIRLGDVRATIVSTQVDAPEGLSKYLPPEALAAETFGEVGPAVDIYALGLVALELLVGSRFETLFDGVAGDPLGGDLAWMRWHGTAESRLPPVAQIVPGVDANLAGVIDRMLAKRVADRPGTAEQVLALLEGGSLPPVAAAPAPAPAPVAPPTEPVAEKKPAGPSLAATIINPPELPPAATPATPHSTLGESAVQAEEKARRTTDSASAATIYFEESETHQTIDNATADTDVESPSQGIAPLPVWHDEVAAKARENRPADVAPPPVPPPPMPRPPVTGTMIAGTMDEVALPRDYERNQTAVRGTMMPEEGDSVYGRPAAAANLTAIPTAPAAKTPFQKEPLPKTGRHGDDRSADEESVPAMRLASHRRRGLFEHPATFLLLSLAVIAAVAYLLFVAWPVDDGTRLVKVTTNPPGAKLFVDGRPREEKTPAEIRLQIGQHDVLVSLDGHYDAAKNLTILKDDTERDISLELPAVPTSRMVRIVTEPADAAVYIDGNPPVAFDSRSPASRELPIGQHKLKIVKPGYLDATQTIEVKLGGLDAAPQVETITLAPVPKKFEDVTVRLDPADAKLMVGGNPVAVTDGKATVPVEEDAQIELSATADGFEPSKQTLSYNELRASGFKVNVDLNPYVTFSPAEAAVKINNAAVALTDGRALLPAANSRQYKIVASAKGYQPLDVTLTREELAARKFRVELVQGPRPPASLKLVAGGKYVHEKLEKAGAPLYFVVIEAGDFIYGAPPSNIRVGELQQGNKKNLKPYLISTTEISVKQYGLFAAEKGEGIAGTQWKPKDLEAAANLPVTNVTHQQAKDFAAFVDGALPTEEQWERATRGTNGRMYPWEENEQPTAKRCNLQFDRGGSLVAVDELPDGATPEGILNMLGNVYEWCDGTYKPGHEDIDQQTPGLNRFPPMRGGSYRDLYNAKNTNARATMRAPSDPARGQPDIGIRVVIPFVEGK